MTRVMVFFQQRRGNFWLLNGRISFARRANPAYPFIMLTVAGIAHGMFEQRQ